MAEETKPPAPPPAPKPTPPPAKEGPVALDNDLVKRYKERFGDAIREAWVDRKQSIIVVAREKWLEVAQYTRDEEKDSRCCCNRCTAPTELVWVCRSSPM